MSNPLNIITSTWDEIAPEGLTGNVHALIQGEHGLGEGPGLRYPALVYSSIGVDASQTTPDGRGVARPVELFQLDFRAHSYEAARELAEAFREAAPETVSSWSYLPDETGIDLILSTTGAYTPRRVAQMTVPFG